MREGAGRGGELESKKEKIYKYGKISREERRSTSSSGRTRGRTRTVHFLMPIISVISLERARLSLKPSTKRDVGVQPDGEASRLEAGAGSRESTTRGSEGLQENL